ncbi:unnamed protein product [Ectocarpus sp. CCAP 1310/34]|nr:unnamed protein product [Ectocarpus sp. CCAP 1310/34]
MPSESWPEQLEGVKRNGASILKKPCVRNALMAGIGTGTLMGIHKFRVGKTVPQACAAWGYTLVLGSCIHMMACTYQLRRKYEDVERQMAMSGAIHASKAPELR